MKQVQLSQRELTYLSIVLEDLTEGCREGNTGGMYTGIAYLTPETCYHMAKILKKINENLYVNPTTYKAAYMKYREYEESK